MADAIIVIRFPDGDVEFDAGPAVPGVGDQVTKRGMRWRVAHVDDTQGRVAVTLTPAEVVRDDSWPAPFEFSR